MTINNGVDLALRKKVKSNSWDWSKNNISKDYSTKKNIDFFLRIKQK